VRETRPQVLLHHINLATHAALTFRAYATAVRDVYVARTPVALRGVAFHETRDPYKDERLNAQTLRRLLDAPDDLPCALEEALVLALPEPFQRECRRELAARYGELAAAIPSGAHGAAVADAATLMRETGEALADLAQCFDGDTVRPEARAQVLRARQDLADVTACVVTLQARLTGALAVSKIPSRADAGAAKAGNG
jgi:hypothetical protein